jgi:hypothetical protein
VTVSPEHLQDLHSLEHRIEREWWWINGALHAVAQLQAEGPHSLRELRAQARNVDRLRLAELSRTGSARPPSANASLLQPI